MYSRPLCRVHARLQTHMRSSAAAFVSLITWHAQQYEVNARGHVPTSDKGMQGLMKPHAAGRLADNHIQCTVVMVAEGCLPELTALHCCLLTPLSTCAACVRCSDIVKYVNQLPPGPLGGSDADQQLAAQWVDKLAPWDGNLFIVANGDPGQLCVCKAG